MCIYVYCSLVRPPLNCYMVTLTNGASITLLIVVALICQRSAVQTMQETMTLMQYWLLTMAVLAISEMGLWKERKSSTANKQLLLTCELGTASLRRMKQWDWLKGSIRSKMITKLGSPIHTFHFLSRWMMHHLDLQHQTFSATCSLS